MPFPCCCCQPVLERTDDFDVGDKTWRCYRRWPSGGPYQWDQSSSQAENVDPGGDLSEGLTLFLGDIAGSNEKTCTIEMNIADYYAADEVQARGGIGVGGLWLTVNNRAIVTVLGVPTYFSYFKLGNPAFGNPDSGSFFSVYDTSTSAPLYYSSGVLKLVVTVTSANNRYAKAYWNGTQLGNWKTGNVQGFPNVSDYGLNVTSLSDLAYGGFRQKVHFSPSYHADSIYAEFHTGADFNGTVPP